MKKITIIFLAFLCVYVADAQHSATSKTTDFQFAKRVTVDPSAGRHFRYEMAVRTESIDTLAGIIFYGIAADKNEQSLPNRFMQIEKRVEQEWTILTLVGLLPEEARSISFFTSVKSPGTYYFDDISLYLQKTPGIWRQSAVYNHSFEENSPGYFAGYAVMNTRSGNPRTALSEKVSKTGKHSLMIVLSRDKEQRVNRSFANFDE